MKFTTVCSLIIVGGALGLISSVSAEPGEFGMPVRVPTTHSGPAFNPPPGASTGTSQPGSPSTSDSASSSGGSSSNGSGSSAGPASARDNSASEGSSARSRNATDVATEIKREKVIDTGDKALETDKVEKATSGDKTFAPGLLDTVSDISAVGAQKAQSSASTEGDSRSKAKPAASEDKGDSHPKN